MGGDFAAAMGITASFAYPGCVHTLRFLDAVF